MSHTTARVDNPQAVAGTVDPVWIRLREEAEAMVRDEPVLAGFALSTILQQPNLESAVIHSKVPTAFTFTVPSMPLKCAVGWVMTVSVGGGGGGAFFE